MSRFALIRALLVVAVCAVAGAVWLAGESQRTAAERSFAELEAAHDLLSAVLDQERGLQGFALTLQPTLLDQYDDGRRRAERTLVRARQGARGTEEDELEAIAGQEAAMKRWQRLAEQAITVIRSGKPIPLRNAKARQELMDRFREINADFMSDLRAERDRGQQRAGLLAVGLILALSTLLGAIGYVFIERRARREARRRTRHGAFKEAMQITRSEGEAYAVLKRHLESWVPGGEAVVLNRNNSADELEPRTALAPSSPLRETLPGAEPDECLAIRSGRVYTRVAGKPKLLACEICDAVDGSATCVPSLVGGEVIGSVLVEHERMLEGHEQAELAASVSEAAPVIGNLRNIVIAEMRAVTDSLTGLANNRAVQETAKRMAAQASRTVSPLAAVLFDLDHFKQINDTFGHGKGDEVLAAIGDAIATDLRDSDFVGRYGGEEFLALLPDTDEQGAVLVAEKLRQTIANVRVPGLDGRPSASFGVAVLPDHAGEINHLLRCADRALYLAKANGRDRVEVFEAPSVGGAAPPHPEAN